MVTVSAQGKWTNRFSVNCCILLMLAASLVGGLVQGPQGSGEGDVILQPAGVIYHDGDLKISGGETYYINETVFQLDGNLIVNGSAVIMLTNSTLVFLMDEQHKYGIDVSDGGEMHATGSTITVSADQLQPWLKLDVGFTDATCHLEDSTLAFPGWFTCSNSQVEFVDAVVRGPYSVSPSLDQDDNDDGPILRFTSCDVWMSDSSLENFYDPELGSSIDVWPQEPGAADTTSETGPNEKLGDWDDIYNLTVDQNLYTAEPLETLAVDQFNTTGLVFPTETVDSVELRVQYATEAGYAGIAAVEYAHSGGAFADSTIVPSDTNGGMVVATYDLTAQGVDTRTELESLQVRFVNGDAAANVSFRTLGLRILLDQRCGDLTLQDSTLTAVECFFDADFNTQYHNRIALVGDSHAYLFAPRFNQTGSKEQPPLAPEGAGADIALYRMVTVSVDDSYGIPLEGVRVSPLYPNNLTAVQPPGGAVCDYLGYAPADWTLTDGRGEALLPLMSDRFNETHLPNGLFVGNYILDVTGTPESLQANLTLHNFPNVGMEDNHPERGFECEKTLMKPYISEYYPLSTKDVAVGGETVYLNGSFAVIDGQSYSSYYGLDGSLRVGAGGRVVVQDTYFQLRGGAEKPRYVCVDAGGELVLDNATLVGEDSQPLPVYVLEGGRLDATDTSLTEVDLLVRNASSLSLVGTEFEGSADLVGQPADRPALYASGCTFDITSGQRFLNCDMDMEDTDVALNTTLVLKKDDVWASNCTFDRAAQLVGGSTADLVNVTFPGVEFPYITAEGSSSATLSYWVTIHVVDGGGNPLEGAVAEVYNFSDTFEPNLYDTGTTDGNGDAVFSGVSSLVDSGGTTFVGNYGALARYQGYSSGMFPTSRSGGGGLQVTQDVLIDVFITQAPDLTVQSLVTHGALIDTNTVGVTVNVTNSGELDAPGFTVRLLADGDPVGDDKAVAGLSAGGFKILEFLWPATQGDVNLTAVVDPVDEVGEKAEGNNEGIDEIVVAPLPYTGNVLIGFSDRLPTVGDNITIYANISNDGGGFATGNLFVSFHLWDPYIVDGDPERRTEPIGETHKVGGLAEDGWVNITQSWTPSQTGEHEIFVITNASIESVAEEWMSMALLRVRTLPQLTLEDGGLTIRPSEGVGILEEARVGETVVIDAVVENAGETDPGPFEVQMGWRPWPWGPQTIVDTTLVPGLGGSETVLVSANWTIPAKGKYLIEVLVDPDDNVTEYDEEDNIHSTALVCYERAELHFGPSGITVVTEQPRQGGYLVLGGTVHNTGETDATNVKIEYYLDGTVPLGNSIIPYVPKDSSADWQFSWLVSVHGLHTITATIDPQNEIQEPLEANNTGEVELQILRMADLSVVSDSVSAEQVGFTTDAEGLVDVAFSVENTGETTALGADLTLLARRLSGPGGEPTGSGTWTTGGYMDDAGPVSPGAQNDYVMQWTVPAAGTYQVKVSIDRSASVGEENEANNEAVLEYTVLGPPDLNVTSGPVVEYQGSQTETVIGLDNVTVGATITNEGGWVSGNLTAQFTAQTLKDDALAGEEIFIGEAGFAPIEPGARAELSLRWLVPDYGRYMVRVQVDPRLMGVDGDRGNDVTSTLLKVDEPTKYPDLTLRGIEVVSQLDGPVKEGAQVYRDQVLYINTTVVNSGHLDTAGVRLHLMVWDAENGGGGDWYAAAEKVITMLPRSQERKVSYAYQAESSGYYKFRVVVDPEDEFGEITENDNFVAYNLTLFDLPDLHFKPDSFPAPTHDLYAGDVVQLEIRVYNKGLADAQNVSVRVYQGVPTVGGTLVFDAPGQTVPAEDRLTLNFDWIAKNGLTDFYIVADPQEQVEELNDNNNVGGQTVLFGFPSRGSVADAEGASGGFPIWALAVIGLVIAAAAGGAVYVLRGGVKGRKDAECSNCGHELYLTDTLCPECGATFEQEIECGRCGELLSFTDNACPKCGMDIAKEKAKAAKAAGITVEELEKAHGVDHSKLEDGAGPKKVEADASGDAATGPQPVKTEAAKAGAVPTATAVAGAAPAAAAVPGARKAEAAAGDLKSGRSANKNKARMMETSAGPVADLLGDDAADPDDDMIDIDSLAPVYEDQTGGGMPGGAAGAAAKDTIECFNCGAAVPVLSTTCPMCNTSFE